MYDLVRYRYMKVKNGTGLVQLSVHEGKNRYAPKVGTEFLLKIFQFGKFSTGTQYHLLISDHGFHTNNIIK
ncbi:hypothetical protein Hanom_Chr15g01391361 [Helianthus anomalus]